MSSVSRPQTPHAVPGGQKVNTSRMAENWRS